MLPPNTARILYFMGYKNGDFDAFDPQDGSGVQVTWNSSVANPPDEAAILAQKSAAEAAEVAAEAAAAKMPNYGELVARVEALEAKAGITPPAKGA